MWKGYKERYDKKRKITVIYFTIYSTIVAKLWFFYSNDLTTVISTVMLGLLWFLRSYCKLYNILL